MIGQLRRGGDVFATLQDDGVWQCDDALSQRVLNTIYSPLTAIAIPSKAMPWWGRDQVTDAGKQYDADIQWPDDSMYVHDEVEIVAKEADNVEPDYQRDPGF